MELHVIYTSMRLELGPISPARNCNEDVYKKPVHKCKIKLHTAMWHVVLQDERSENIMQTSVQVKSWKYVSGSSCLKRPSTASGTVLCEKHWN